MDAQRKRYLKNDMLFRRWYSDNIVRFVGGPMHEEVLKVPDLRPEWKCAVPEPMESKFFLPTELPQSVRVKTARYRLMSDGFVVLKLGWTKLWMYVFSGCE